MSSFTLLCLLLVFLSMGHGFVQRLVGLHNFYLVNSFLESPNRIKRDDDMCTELCARSTNDNFDRYLPETNKLVEDMSKDPNSITMMSKSKFELFCKNIINPATICLDKCYSSSLDNTVLKNAMVPARFLCQDHYNEIMSNYDCTQTAKKVTKAHCENGKCKDLNQAPAILIRQSKFLGQSRDFDTFKKLLANSCEYISCSMHCEKPIVAEMCNERIANLTENDFIGTVMQNSKKLLAVVHAEFVWPAQCEKILTETGYDSASKSAGVFALITLLLMAVLKLT